MNQSTKDRLVQYLHEDYKKSDDKDPDKARFVDTTYCKYIVAVVSATNSEIVTFPLDLIKTRLQVQGEVAAAKEGVSTAPYKGTFKTGLEIVQKDGVMKLWEGWTPAIWRHAVYSGVRIVAYQELRERLLKPNLDGSYPFWKSCLNGMLSGVIGQFLANPADLVKVQIQMEGKRRLLGLPPRVKTPFKALKKIYKTGGIPGLWAGAVPNMQRAAMVNLGDLTGYDLSKRFLLRFPVFHDDIITHSIASLIAGLVAAILTTPFDTMKTRLMNQPTDAQGRGLLYNGTTDCFIKAVTNEGPLSLYKGFLPLYLRLGPWAFVFWISYENIEKLIGAATF